LNRKKKNIEWLFFLLIPMGYGYLYILENKQEVLGENGIVWMSILLWFLVIIVGIFLFHHDEDFTKKQQIQEDEHFNGVQIVLHLPKNMPEDPYSSNGEKFIRIDFIPKYIESILAIGVLVSFFLPWVRGCFLELSPCDLLLVDGFKSKYSLLLLIPILSILLIFLSKYKKIKSFVALFLGFSPFLLLFLLLPSRSFEIADMKKLSDGFYLFSIFSIFLIVPALYRIFNQRIYIDRREIAVSSKTLKFWLALGILGTFFLPWFQVSSFSLSGYELLMDENYRKIYWFIGVIPLNAIGLALNYKFNQKVKYMAFLTGVMPFIVLSFGFLLLDINLFMILSFGAYITLFLGIILILFSIKTNKKKL